MADNYTYRDIASGEAFREHLGSLGWSKPRKNQPGFTQEYGEDLIFRAAFLYATFNHTPGNYSGIPAFYVMSKKWRKTLRKMVTITEYAQSSPSNRRKVGVSRRKSVKICLVEIRLFRIKRS